MLWGNSLVLLASTRHLGKSQSGLWSVKAQNFSRFPRNCWKTWQQASKVIEIACSSKLPQANTRVCTLRMALQANQCKSTCIRVYVHLYPGLYIYIHEYASVSTSPASVYIYIYVCTYMQLYLHPTLDPWPTISSLLVHPSTWLASQLFVLARNPSIRVRRGPKAA